MRIETAGELICVDFEIHQDKLKGIDLLANEKIIAMASLACFDLEPTNSGSAILAFEGIQTFALIDEGTLVFETFQFGLLGASLRNYVNIVQDLGNDNLLFEGIIALDMSQQITDHQLEAAKANF